MPQGCSDQFHAGGMIPGTAPRPATRFLLGYAPAHSTAPMTELQDLATLIRSATPLLAIETAEENRRLSEEGKSERTPRRHEEHEEEQKIF
jgi:hypothetical protein